MTTSLALKNEHLGMNRRLIVLRTLGAAVSGLTPLPYLNDWLAAAVKRGTIRRIADARGVDADDDAVRAVAEGVVPPPTWTALVASAPLARFLRAELRALMYGYSIYKRADQASRDFAVATLFDHYCARMHVGGELDRDAGAALRARIERAIGTTPSGPLRQAFVAGLRAAGRAAVRAPFELADAVSGGRLRARLRARSEADAEEVADEALVEEKKGPLLERMAQTVDRSLLRLGSQYVDHLILSFEEEGA